MGQWECHPVLHQKEQTYIKMSPVSPVFYTEVIVSIGLKNKLRVGTSIPSY